MAEIEWPALTPHCVGRRIADSETLARDHGRGDAAQRNASDGRTAVYDGESAHEAGEPLPVMISLAAYKQSRYTLSEHASYRI